MDHLSSPTKNQVRVLLAYDIVADDRRARAAEAVLDFLPRSQLSVFDGWIPANTVSTLWSAVLNVVKTTEDEALMIALCQPCTWYADGLGAAASPDTPNTGWIV